MAEDKENFRDALEKMAEVVDILENTFIGKKNIEIGVSLDENTFESISNYLDYDKNLNKCIINIGGTNFTFLKK
jgi:hypothetical protein